MSTTRRPANISLLGLATAALLAGPAGPASPLSAQAVAADAGAAAAGTWRAIWASAVRTWGDDRLEVQRESDAVLVLEARGDSLTGTWTFELPALGRSIWTVEGTWRNGRISLVGTEAEIEHPPPASRGRIVRQEWTGTVDGDRITDGEHWMVLELPSGEQRTSGPRPWSARRH